MSNLLSIRRFKSALTKSSTIRKWRTPIDLETLKLLTGCNMIILFCSRSWRISWTRWRTKTLWSNYGKIQKLSKMIKLLENLVCLLILIRKRLKLRQRQVIRMGNHFISISWIRKKERLSTSNVNLFISSQKLKSTSTKLNIQVKLFQRLHLLVPLLQWAKRNLKP